MICAALHAVLMHFLRIVLPTQHAELGMRLMFLACDNDNSTTSQSFSDKQNIRNRPQCLNRVATTCTLYTVQCTAITQYGAMFFPPTHGPFVVAVLSRAQLCKERSRLSAYSKYAEISLGKSRIPTSSANSKPYYENLPPMRNHISTSSANSKPYSNIFRQLETIL